MITSISNYGFRVADLNLPARKPGISAFMRVRNGAEFLAETVCSHLDYFDEIVIVFNQCIDDTEAIVTRLLEAFPDKIRAFHYLDRVQPLGHPSYGSMAYDSPQSMGNYSNFALAQTRFTVATKLDDDHICIPGNLRPLIDDIRQRGFRLGQTMLCFSGLNLFAAPHDLEILGDDPFGGDGDHGYFEVSEQTIFRHNRKHETFDHRSLRREFSSLTYLHCKYLKAGYGFGNYELETNPDSRFARKRERLEHYRQTLTLDELRSSLRYAKYLRGLLPLLPEKAELKLTRAAMFDDQSAALDINGLIRQARAAASIHVRSN